MNLKDAVKHIKAIAAAPDFDRKRWNEFEARIVAAGYCPACATDDESPAKIKLMPWQPGNVANYAGRECPRCEDFFRCGTQSECNTDPDSFSDADPGL